MVERKPLSCSGACQSAAGVNYEKRMALQSHPFVSTSFMVYLTNTIFLLSVCPAAVRR